MPILHVKCVGLITAPEAVSGDIRQRHQLAAGAQLTMASMLERVGGVSALMAHIGDASHAQTDGIAQMNEAVAGLEHDTRNNAALVEEVAAASESLRQQAEVLGSLMEKFQLADTHPSQGVARPLLR